MQTTSATTYLASHIRPMAAPQPQARGTTRSTEPAPKQPATTVMKAPPLPVGKALTGSAALASLAAASAKTAPTVNSPDASVGKPQPQQESGQPITLEGLLKAWGQNIAEYDLNGDGTVDVLDLLMFLDQNK